MHIHPVANSGREHGVKDDEISVISSKERQKLYTDRNKRKQSSRGEWHSDITFEPIPSDYTLLRLTELPETGGGMYNLYFVNEDGLPNFSKIPSGLPDTKFTIAFQSPISSFSTV